MRVRVHVCVCVHVFMCACVSVAVAMQSVLRYIAPTTWPVTSLAWDSVRGLPHGRPGLPVGARVVPQCCCKTFAYVRVQLYVYTSACACACVCTCVCVCMCECYCCYAVSAEVYCLHDMAGNQPSLGFRARIASQQAWPASRSKGSTSVLLRNMCICTCATVCIYKCVCVCMCVYMCLCVHV